MDDHVSYDPKSEKTFLHTGRQADILYDGEVIGFIGEIHPRVAKNYKIGTRVYLAVIDMPHIYDKASFEKKYTGIANFPASTRDLSLVIPSSILAGDIEKVFDVSGGEYMESYKLFDLYEGDQIEKGKKSMAYSIVFRAKDRNLEDNDVNTAMDAIMKGLNDLGVVLRS